MLGDKFDDLLSDLYFICCVSLYSYLTIPPPDIPGYGRLLITCPRDEVCDNTAHIYRLSRIPDIHFPPQSFL